MIRAWIVSMAVVLACGGTAPKRQAPPPPEPRDEFVVLDAGAAPRTVLRYRVPVGTRRRMSTTLDMKFSAPTPGILFRGAYDVTAVDAAHVHTIRTTVDEVEVSAQPGVDASVTAAVKEEIDSLIGTVMTMKMDDRGRFSDYAVDLASSPGAEDLLSSMGDEYAVPLPREAIGVGARWRVPFEMEQNGLRVVGDIVWTLVAVEGSVVTIRGAMRLSNAEHHLTGAGTLETRMDLVALRGANHVTITVADATIEMTMRYE